MSQGLGSDDGRLGDRVERGLGWVRVKVKGNPLHRLFFLPDCFRLSFYLFKM